jgi:hypothetical protein
VLPRVVTAPAFTGISPALLQEWLLHSGTFYGMIALLLLVWRLFRAG